MENKKIYLASSAIILIVLCFSLVVSPVWASDCEKKEKKQEESYLSSYFNPLVSFAEKMLKGFGYDVVLAAAPDPDFCGSDNTYCSGGSASVDISWSAAPARYSWYSLGYYVLTVNGVNSWNTGLNTSRTINGLTNNKLYRWSVEAYYNTRSSASLGFTSQPYGSFTTLNCAPPTVTLNTWSIFELPDPVSLYWNSTNANSCVASGDWSGDKAVSGEDHLSKARGDYVFTLTCTGLGGSALDTENVKVIQVPRCSFTANPGSIVLPASSTLSWSCQYADSCSIDQGIGSISPVSGAKDVRPTSTTTYTLNCSGLDDSRFYSATVNVGFEPVRREVPPR